MRREKRPVHNQFGGQADICVDANHACHLVKRTALVEGIAAMLTKPMLHGDNGATLKATTVLAGDAPVAGRHAFVLATSREGRQRLRRVFVPHRQVSPGVPRQGLQRPKY